jgi:hypothetical protein
MTVGGIVENLGIVGGHIEPREYLNRRCRTCHALRRHLKQLIERGCGLAKADQAGQVHVGNPEYTTDPLS